MIYTTTAKAPYYKAFSRGNVSFAGMKLWLKIVSKPKSFILANGLYEPVSIY